MTRNRWLLIIPFVVFVVGLIVNAPARVAIHWFAPETVRVSGISGTVWQGQATAIDTSGVYLRDVSWELKPLSALLGKLTLQLDASPTGGFLSTEVSVKSGSRVDLTNLTAALPLSLFAEAVRTRGLSGQANLRFDTLRVENGAPVAADGTIEIAGLVVPILYPGSLGGYRLEFDSADDGVVASIEETDGIVDIAGSLSFKTDRSYQILALVDARRDTPERVKTQINYLPQVGNGTQREVRLEGAL